MNQSLVQFKSYLTSFRNLSPSTVSQYCWAARAFVQEIGDKPEYTREDILGYITGLKQCSGTYRRWTCQVVKSFLENTGKVWPLRKGELPSISPPFQPSVSADEAMKVLDTIKSHPLEYALLRTLFSTGLRRGEVAQLQRRDFKPPFLHANLEKREGPLIKELDEETCRAMDKYLRTRQDTSSWLFTNSRGRPLSPASISNLYRSCFERAGLEPRGPHSSRRAVTSWLYEGGMGIKELQIFGGWKTELMPLRYIQLREDVIMRRAVELSPIR